MSRTIRIVNWLGCIRHPYSVCLLNYVSNSSIEFAKSMLEWMSDAIVKKFDNNRENQFNFR